ncbi:MAG: helix-turn-helix domain-containing protein, partial [Anaerolineales bacterium]|nr:helix-turn-helix domain-containing protein [Anaerolineales bacterium]
MTKDLPSFELNLGARIKELRTERNLSIRAVSKKSGISLNALSRIERNLTSPSVSTLYKIAEALDIPMSRFFQDRYQCNDVVFCKKDHSAKVPFLRGLWEGLGCEQFAGGIQPFLLTLEAGGGSGRYLM